jgi:hypothetical protein
MTGTTQFELDDVGATRVNPIPVTGGMPQFGSVQTPGSSARTRSGGPSER